MALLRDSWLPGRFHAVAGLYQGLFAGRLGWFLAGIPGRGFLLLLGFTEIFLLGLLDYFFDWILGRIPARVPGMLIASGGVYRELIAWLLGWLLTGIPGRFLAQSGLYRRLFAGFLGLFSAWIIGSFTAVLPGRFVALTELGWFLARLLGRFLAIAGLTEGFYLRF